MSSGSITFSYDPATRIRTAVYRGVVDDTDLFEAYTQLAQDPDLDVSAHDLADLCPAEKLEFTSDGLARLGRLLTGSDEPPPLRERSKLAIVADSPFAFGLARMYELMTESYLPKITRVFRSREEAEAWLLAE